MTEDKYDRDSVSECAVVQKVVDLNFRCPLCGEENTIEGITREKAANMTKATCSQCGRTSVFYK